MLTLEDRSRIAQRAATLGERLAHGRHALPGIRQVGDSPLDSGALKTWQRAFSAGDREAFLRRLSWDGFDAWSLAAALEVSESTPPTPPAWTTWLQRFGQHATALGRELPSCGIPPEVAWLVAGSRRATSTTSHDEGEIRKSEPPFVELWIPVVRAIYAELRYAGRNLVSALPSPVRHGLERTWLADIAAAGQHAAWDAFQRHVASPGDLVREHPPWHRERPPSDRYDAFISHQLREGLAPLFREFPVLARDLALVAETGAQAALELLRRLDHDRDVIGEAFAQGRDPGTLTDLHGGLSDPHGGRRRVAALTFSSGLRLVYKPRDVRLESGFSDMVAWLGTRGLVGAPPIARIVARDRYGWAEFISPSECRNESQARQAYDAAGALLCLAWALGARDLHWQNVIATSRGPVLIDLETLLQPEGFAAAAANLPSGSVKPPGAGDGATCLSSGLLSSLETRGDGRAVEVGGLRGRADRVPPVEVVEWSNLRTDAIEKHIARRAVAPGLNLITVAGHSEDPASYGDSVLEGYRRTYQYLLAHRDALVGAEGLIARWFGSGSSRLVLRPSRLYGEALAALREPQFLRDGITRGIALETLNRPFSSCHQRPRVWPLTTEERRALTALDIPRFSVRADERCVREARDAGDLFRSSGLAAVDARLAAMSEDALVAHETAIAAALSVSVSTRYSVEPRLPRPERGADDQTDWHGAALWLAEEVLRLSQDPQEVSSRASLRNAMSMHALYDGRLGVALFLAALLRSHHDARYEAVVRAALRDADAYLDIIDSCRGRAGVDVGAAAGLGSIALAAMFISQVHPDARAGRLAERAAALLDEACLRRCPASDLLAGTAGAVLALLALRHRAGAERWIDMAVTAGDLLLERARMRDGNLVWPSPDVHTCLGFAHGNSGIAYALLQLASVTGHTRFAEAALSALEYERPFYSPAERSWPALVDDDTEGNTAGLTVWMNAWCYGAAGMALARIRAGRLTADASLEAEAARALAATVTASPSMAEHLCCGNLGRADIMLTAARWRGDAALAERSRDVAADVLRRCMQRGHVALSSSGVTYVISRAGFFQGLAGVGYHWLRQASPEALPSVLAFEPLNHVDMNTSFASHVHAVD